MSQTPAYHVGDRVEANDLGWYKGTITQVGSGNMQGYYLVKYDDYSSQRYFKPASLRPGGPPDKPKSYPVYKIGDHVEGNDLGWYSAVVTEIRAGKDAPEYLLKYDKYSSSRWYHPRNMRAAGTGDAVKAQDQAATAQGPRIGKYGVYTYGAASSPPLYLGHFDLLPGNQYRVSRTSGAPYFGQGTYRFNAAASTVE
ncbi:MAG: tudor domain-containing protein, partial [Gammaproteobacteria bacterium]